MHFNRKKEGFHQKRLLLQRLNKTPVLNAYKTGSLRFLNSIEWEIKTNETEEETFFKTFALTAFLKSSSTITLKTSKGMR